MPLFTHLGNVDANKWRSARTIALAVVRAARQDIEDELGSENEREGELRDSREPLEGHVVVEIEAGEGHADKHGKQVAVGRGGGGKSK